MTVYYLSEMNVIKTFSSRVKENDPCADLFRAVNLTLTQAFTYEMLHIFVHEVLRYIKTK